MSDGPDWFAPKRYGYGIGIPIRWQGWALTIGYLALAVMLSVTLADRPLQLVAIMVPLTATYLVTAIRTTKDGLRWRWGEKE